MVTPKMVIGLFIVSFFTKKQNKYMKFHLRKPIPWVQIMKITLSQTLIAVLLTSMAYSNALKAQDILNKKVNLSIQNASLADALKGLQKNNDIKFIYSKNSINVQQKISIEE